MARRRVPRAGCMRGRRRARRYGAGRGQGATARLLHQCVTPTEFAHTRLAATRSAIGPPAAFRVCVWLLAHSIHDATPHHATGTMHVEWLCWPRPRHRRTSCPLRQLRQMNCVAAPRSCMEGGQPLRSLVCHPIPNSRRAVPLCAFSAAYCSLPASSSLRCRFGSKFEGPRGQVRRSVCWAADD